MNGFHLAEFPFLRKTNGKSFVLVESAKNAAPNATHKSGWLEGDNIELADCQLCFFRFWLGETVVVSQMAPYFPIYCTIFDRALVKSSALL